MAKKFSDLTFNDEIYAVVWKEANFEVYKVRIKSFNEDGITVEDKEKHRYLLEPKLLGRSSVWSNNIYLCTDQEGLDRIKAGVDAQAQKWYDQVTALIVADQLKK